MKVLFWNVDTQKDFMDKEGKLYVQADNIRENLKKLTQFANEKNIKVVNTGDFHNEGSTEISDKPDFINTFPKHCMVGTNGLDFIPETEPEAMYIYHYVDSVIDLNFIDVSRNIVIYKDDFDVFKGNLNTENILKYLKPDEVIVYGVVTNVCVNSAVLGLKERGYKVTVVLDAIKELPNSNPEEVMNKWRKIGVGLISTEELIKSLS